MDKNQVAAKTASQTFEVLETSKVSRPRHQPYPTYKPSGVTWLGDIPAHWEVKRLKNAVRLNPETLPETTDPDFVLQYVDISNVEEVSGANPPQEMRFESAPSRARRVVRAGDTILSTVRTYLKAIAYFENPSENLIVSTGFAVLRPKPEIEPKFLHTLVRSKEFIETVVAHSVGVGYPAINPSELACLPIWIPPLPEQRAIAAYLDRETARLDTLVAKNERLIELLQEKRTALISHAVTRGLDTNAPLKDSGVAWLGNVPKHWEARQFKHVAEINYGLTLELDRTETEGTCILSLPNVTKEGQLVLDDVPKTPLTPEQKKQLLLHKGDLLFNWRNGSADHVGKTAYFGAEGEYTHVSFLLRLRFDLSKFESRYYQMFLNNLRNRDFFSSSKTRVNTTYNQAELGRLVVMVPSLDEQRAIAAYLDRETAKIDALIAKVRQAIETLKEYRTALISAAVTGKMDVREMPG